MIGFGTTFFTPNALPMARCVMLSLMGEVVREKLNLKTEAHSHPYKL